MVCINTYSLAKRVCVEYASHILSALLSLSNNLLIPPLTEMEVSYHSVFLSSCSIPVFRSLYVVVNCALVSFPYSLCIVWVPGLPISGSPRNISRYSSVPRNIFRYRYMEIFLGISGDCPRYRGISGDICQ